MKRAILLLPLGIFLIVAVFLFRGLWLDPSELPSALIGKPFPAFDLPSVQDPARRLTEADLRASRRWSTSGAPGARRAGSSTRN